MKIIHICLACFYKERFGYQENILPRIHKELGHDVLILAPAQKVEKDTMIYATQDYINDDGIFVKIIKKRKFKIPVLKHLNNALRIYDDFSNILEEFEPNIIFVHGGQSISINQLYKYLKKNTDVKLYIDQHGDYYNSPVNKVSSRLLAKIHGHYLRKIALMCNCFWGVTPWRCQYLEEVYNIPKNKIQLLVMGGDDRFIHFEKSNQIRSEIRKKYNIAEDDFVIITGGKIDITKNIHLLMEAIVKLNTDKIKLIVFGKPLKEMQTTIEELSTSSNIINIGWIESTKVYDYFLASDLAVFPGTHSVLWEQACACGIPAVFKNWNGMHHVDLGGNCVFLNEDNVEQLMDIINEIYIDKEKYLKMKQTAEKKCIPEFSYKNIARRAIDLDDEYIKQ